MRAPRGSCRSEFTNGDHQTSALLNGLILLAQEFSHIEIAEKLEISRRTVEGHNKSLRAKLKVKGVIGLVKYAIENGLI
jgi:DNA-binding NarL/FixJ family response regulator